MPHYDIYSALEILPHLSWGLLIAVLVLKEVQCFREFLTERSTERPEPGSDGFTPPPGDGYRHYINSSTIVYIQTKGRGHYRIYLVRGDAPRAKLRSDRYGRYFKVSCPDEGRAEKIAENAFA